jgi:acid phosphatase type 7
VTGKIPSSGVISIGGTSASTNGADFDSRETSLDPQLVITKGTEPSPTPTTPPPSGDPILVGAGDIASTGTGDNATADLIAAMPSTATVFAAGDNAYPDGTLSNYNNNYHPSWGQFKARTIPAPGNHEYHTSGASGYFDYFGSLAGPNRNGWFSKNIGNWHVISLSDLVGTRTWPRTPSGWRTATAEPASRSSPPPTSPATTTS